MADPFVATIARLRPDLVGRSHRVLANGHDCTAVAVEGEWLFRFPRNAAAGGRLQAEARILAALAGQVALPIPRPHYHPGPPACSLHAMIPGQHLLTPDYDRLGKAPRQRLAADLAGLLADLHAMDLGVMRGAGAGQVQGWATAGQIADRALPLVPLPLQALAQGVLAACAALPPDPLGQVFGHFDLHGWNMAFDPAAQRLNGVYDFGDCGIGPLHREFVCPGFISPDLVARMIDAYQARTGRTLDAARIRCLTGTHRLWELAEAAGTPHEPAMLANFLAFAAQPTG